MISVAKLKETKFQRMIFLVSAIVMLLVIMNGTDTVKNGSYCRYKNGGFDSISGGTVHFSHRTGEETQNIHFCEDVYLNGKLLSTQQCLSLGMEGEVCQNDLWLSLSVAPALFWTLNADGAVTYWITELEEASYSRRTVKHLQPGKHPLTGEDNVVLAAVFQNSLYSRGDGYPQECDDILNDLDAVISKNDTVVLIRMVTS